MNPNNPSLSDIAQQIVHNRAIENIQFYLVYGALAIITIAVGCMVTAYYSEKGKIMAAAASLSHRLDEIRQSTDAAEKIKIQIAHNDWTLKELKTLRRNKLEELMTAAYRVLFTTESDAGLPTEDSTYEVRSRQSLTELQQISALYFPELMTQTEAVAEAHLKFGLWFIHERSKIRQQRMKSAMENRILDVIAGVPERIVGDVTQADQLVKIQESNALLGQLQQIYADEYPTYHRALRSAVHQVQSGATQLMAELIAPTVH